MIHHGEDNIATEQNKKWYSIYKNNICCHKYIFVKLDDFPGNLHKVPYYVDLFLNCGVPF